MVPSATHDSQPSLSISGLAERTGVPAATLRSWEARYGLPRPHRLTGGHRRYGEHDVALVEEILRQRASGLSLHIAVDRAGARTDELEPSVFAGLRRSHPELVPQLLRKSTLLALTRAIEDECCARAEHAVLFASFQRERFYRQSAARWAELARTARAVVVFADFPEAAALHDSPLTVSVPSDAPLRREWALVCDSPNYPACLAGWERPAEQAVSDANRRFETLWTVDPRAVRDAARICAQLAEAFCPDLDRRLSDLLTGTPSRASADLRRAAGLLNRMVGYLETATAR
ncbi:MAG: DICT sensory domain-containing protein [Nocardioidaceae bacterium]